MERISLDCITAHPITHPILRLVNTLKAQGNSSLLPPHIIESSQRLSPIHVVKAPLKPGHFLCFSGFKQIALLNSIGAKGAWTIIHDIHDEQTIFEQAWHSEIINQLHGPHRSGTLKSLHDLIDLAPKTMRKMLTKNRSSASPMTLTEVLTGESRSAIRNQFPKLVERPSELDTLLGKE